MKKKVTIGFLGNINYDTRTFNLLKSLKAKNFDVKFYGFDWLTPEFKTFKNDNIFIEKLFKRKYSIFFYLKFGIKLLSKLFYEKTDIYFAADVYSLPFCVIVAKLKRKKVFYDAREVYTEIPALETKPFVKSLMRIIEGHYIKKADLVLTTGKMDSLYIEKLYGIQRTEVLRNLPLIQKQIKPVNFEKLFPSENMIKLLYQGVVVRGRGLDLSFEALTKNDKLVLIILGAGEDLEYYKILARQMKISDRVYFAGKISQTELLNYTAGADIGLALIDNISKNNLYALPNKLFEYLMANLPVVVTNMPQMKEIVEKYQVGFVIPCGQSTSLLNSINELIEDKKYAEFKENSAKASAILNWENEFSKILKYFTED